jgi:uroporphyrinogen decarboxylase
VEHIFASLQKSKVPRLHFGTNTAGLLRDFASVDAEVIGLDWRVDIAAAKKIVGPKSIQGNLEPTLLLGDWRTIRTSTDHILSSLNPKRGFIFNFGHGVLPETDDRVLKRLVEYVHNK